MGLALTTGAAGLILTSICEKASDETANNTASSMMSLVVNIFIYWCFVLEPQNKRRFKVRKKNKAC